MTEIHDLPATSLTVSDPEKFILTGAVDGVVKVQSIRRVCTIRSPSV